MNQQITFMAPEVTAELLRVSFISLWLNAHFYLTSNMLLNKQEQGYSSTEITREITEEKIC